MPIRSIRFGFLLQVALILVLSSLFYSHTLEDAFITFRYSKHLAEGYGFGAWNTDGSRVEGYTTWLWMVLSAFWYGIGVSEIQAAKVTGILATIASVFCLRNFSSLAPALSDERDSLGVAASWWLSLSLPLAYYATTGMEATTFAFVAFLLFVAAFSNRTSLKFLQWVLIPLLILLRPEGILLCLAIYTFKLCTPAVMKQHRLSAVGAVFFSGLVWTLFVVYRYISFGYVFPNTYYAKVADGGAHWQLGLKYLNTYYQADPLLIILFAGALLVLVRIVQRREALVSLATFLGAFLGVYALYVAKVGGDNPSAFNYWRHIVHISPFLALAVAVAMHALTIRVKERAVLFIVGALLFNLHVYGMSGHISRFLRDIERGKRTVRFSVPRPSSFERWLVETFPADTVLATSRAGQLPYFVDFPVIDILGLNNEHIAHHGTFQKGVIDSKTDIAYVLDQRPGLIETTIKHAHVYEGIPIKKPQSYWRIMEDQLMASEIFKNEYLFLKELPSAGRALFIHNRLYQELQESKKLEAVPVLQTSIYTFGR